MGYKLGSREEHYEHKVSVMLINVQSHRRFMNMRDFGLKLRLVQLCCRWRLAAAAHQVSPWLDANTNTVNCTTQRYTMVGSMQMSDWESSEVEWFITLEVPVLLNRVSVLMQCPLSNQNAWSEPTVAQLTLFVNAPKCVLQDRSTSLLKSHSTPEKNS